MADANLKKYLVMKNEVRNIFEDLEVYKQFCVDYGYVYDERHLYNERTPYGEFVRYQNGKTPWDHWRSPRRERTDFRPRDANSNWKVRENRQ
jgi:hypothetical protein